MTGDLPIRFRNSLTISDAGDPANWMFHRTQDGIWQGWRATQSLPAFPRFSLQSLIHFAVRLHRTVIVSGAIRP